MHCLYCFKFHRQQLTTWADTSLHLQLDSMLPLEVPWKITLRTNLHFPNKNLRIEIDVPNNINAIINQSALTLIYDLDLLSLIYAGYVAVHESSK